MGQIYNIISLDRIEENINTVARNSFGVFICTAGRARVSIGDKVYEVERDVMFFYAPYTVIRILERSADWDGMLLEEEANMLFTIISGTKFKRPLAIRDYPCFRVTAGQREAVMELLAVLRRRDDLLAAHIGDDSEPLLRDVVMSMVRAFCMELIAIYFDCTPIDDLPQSRASRVYNRFMSSVFDNCMTHRTVAFYAAEQYLSPGHFSVIVRNISGQTAMKWIEIMTMAKARKLLADMSLSIKEIAAMMHFADQSAFGRYFRSREGISPSDYRRR